MREGLWGVWRLAELGKGGAVGVLRGREWEGMTAEVEFEFGGNEELESGETEEREPWCHEVSR